MEPPFAARATSVHVREGEHCNVYQMREPLIGTDVVQKILLAVVRTRSS